MFNTTFGIDSKEFQNYYRDLAKKVKNKEVDLLIVVGMFLTGFDAPTLNTLFVDKRLRYHGLIQAFSRTNRIYDSTKKFGNIVTFRDLEQAAIDAITLFGDSRGYVEVVKELKKQFPHPDEIATEADKKAFVQLFGEYLRIENVLQNYDEFDRLKALHALDAKDSAAVSAFKERYFLTDEAFDNALAQMQGIDVLTERTVQDYRSTYNDIRDWLRRERDGDNKVQRNRRNYLTDGVALCQWLFSTMV